MVSELTFFLIILLIFVIIKEIIIPMKNCGKFIAKGMYSYKDIFSRIFSSVLMIYIYSMGFFNKFHKAYKILYPKYIVGFKDMFNYNELMNIYNILEKNNIPRADYIYEYINNGVGSILNHSIFLLILFINIINENRNKIYENVIYVDGIKCTSDNLKDFEWSEKRIKNRFGKIREYYELTLTVEKKRKILGNSILNKTTIIKEEDQDKINFVLANMKSKYELSEI